jgi:REP-associated tyrosine transposase
MPCRYQNRLAAGIYYASRRTEPPLLIFCEPRDYEDFEEYLAQALERTNTSLLGYCWMPDAIHLALGVNATPLGEVMRQVTRYCSQRIRKRTGSRVNYIDSFPIMLSEPESHLPMLLRYIHSIPVLAGAAVSPGEYPYTSHRAYVGGSPGPHVCTTALQKLIRVPRPH